MRYVYLYNMQFLQSALKAGMSILEMKELFGKRPYYLTGCDT